MEGTAGADLVQQILANTRAGRGADAGGETGGEAERESGGAGCCHVQCDCCGCACDEASCPGVCHAVPNFEVAPAAKAFLCLASLEAVFEVAFCVWLLAAAGDEGEAYLWFYAVLAIFITTAFAYFAWDAVWAENQAQLVGALALSAFGTVYIAFKYVYPGEELGPTWADYKLLMLVLKCVWQALYLALARPVRDSFGYSAWKVIGGDQRLNLLYSHFLWTWALLRLDFVLACTLVLMYGFFFSDVERFTDANHEILLNSVALVLTLAVAVFAWVGVTRERGCVMWLFYFWSLAEPCYVGYKLYCIYTDACYVPQAVIDAGKGQFFALGGCAIVVKAATVLCAARCHRAFGQGLRHQVFRKTRRHSAQ